MKYEINFDRDAAHNAFCKIYVSFASTEEYFKRGDLARNIRNAFAFSEAVRSLKIFGADVDASGIYDDHGFDRIGYARINGHEFVVNGEFSFSELRAALDDIVADTAYGE